MWYNYSMKRTFLNFKDKICNFIENISIGFTGVLRPEFSKIVKDDGGGRNEYNSYYS